MDQLVSVIKLQTIEEEILSSSKESLFVKRKIKNIHFTYCLILSTFILYFLFCLEVIIKKFRACSKTCNESTAEISGKIPQILHILGNLGPRTKRKIKQSQ